MKCKFCKESNNTFSIVCDKCTFNYGYIPFSVIFCNYCYTNNDIKNDKCVNCKKELCSLCNICGNFDKCTFNNGKNLCFTCDINNLKL